MSVALIEVKGLSLQYNTWLPVSHLFFFYFVLSIDVLFWCFKESLPSASLLNQEISCFVACQSTPSYWQEFIICWRYFALARKAVKLQSIQWNAIEQVQTYYLDLMQKVYIYFRSTKDFIVTDICFYTSKNEVSE